MTVENLDFSAWRCTHDDTKFCPDEGCPKWWGCARDHGWEKGMPSPRECQGLPREEAMTAPDWRAEGGDGIPPNDWWVRAYENGEHVEDIAALVDERTAKHIAASWRMREALTDATKALIAERDCYYDSVTNSKGEIIEETDGLELADMDRLIDKCRAAQPMET